MVPCDEEMYWRGERSKLEEIDGETEWDIDVGIQITKLDYITAALRDVRALRMYGL